MKGFILLCAISLIFGAVGDINDFNAYPEIKRLIAGYASNYSYKFNKIFKDGPVYSGDGTAYGSSTNGGNCLFPAKTYYKDMMYAAINHDQYIDDLGCGLCAAVVSPSNPNKVIRVRVLDQCPECAHGSLDFSDKAFKELTGMDPARVKITWALIPCDVDINEYKAVVPKGSPIKFQFKSGSSQWWFQVQIFNTRYPVASVEMKVGNEFISLRRENHNYWVRPEANVGPAPYTFRVTLADSSVVLAKDVEMVVPSSDEGEEFSTGTQTVTA